MWWSTFHTLKIQWWILSLPTVRNYCNYFRFLLPQAKLEIRRYAVSMFSSGEIFNSELMEYIKPDKNILDILVNKRGLPQRYIYKNIPKFLPIILHALLLGFLLGIISEVKVMFFFSRDYTMTSYTDFSRFLHTPPEIPSGILRKVL